MLPGRRFSSKNDDEGSDLEGEAGTKEKTVASKEKASTSKTSKAKAAKTAENDGDESGVTPVKPTRGRKVKTATEEKTEEGEKGPVKRKRRTKAEIEAAKLD